jgi:cytochrome bd-type quinol oxidase subunit 2
MARHEPSRPPVKARSDSDRVARVLVWVALGWTAAMMLVVVFLVKFGEEGTFFDRMGPYAVVLGLIPILIVSLPLIAVVSEKVKRITPIVAVVTTALVILSITLTGGFFIPAAFALGAAALLEIADSRTGSATQPTRPNRKHARQAGDFERPHNRA